MPTTASVVVDQARRRVHQHLEGEPDADGGDQHREEDHRPEITAGDDLRGQQQGQRHAENDLRPGGDHRVDQGVAQAGDQRLLVEERRVVLQADPGRGEQVPSGKGEVEGSQSRNDEKHCVDDPGDHIEPVRVGSRSLLPRSLRLRLAGAKRVASDVLSVLAMAKPFRESPAAGPGRDRRQDESTLTSGPIGPRAYSQPGKPSCWACFLTSWS